MLFQADARTQIVRLMRRRRTVSFIGRIWASHSLCDSRTCLVVVGDVAEAVLPYFRDLSVLAQTVGIWYVAIREKNFN